MLVFFYRSVLRAGEKLAIVYYGHQHEETCCSSSAV